ncbi:hypothetical protein O7627_17725 [Solwaraspora sp. WMMD1047]|uniref:hypothetical protein n=1 Tax=Solwaraspora sp. WMMD1047 TaxID=3016102 RepID=UPI0024180871|nr:hypothetical protein [Solwaraspora sp. WMMD1047]MDG4831137.1 hypothetical protein [Solwaraspora sp. WMMD1047]
MPTPDDRDHPGPRAADPDHRAADAAHGADPAAHDADPAAHDADPAAGGADPARTGTAEPVRPRPGWLERRRDKIAAEVARNRQGGHKVPTWVLAAVLLLIVGAWATLVLLA